MLQVTNYSKSLSGIKRKFFMVVSNFVHSPDFLIVLIAIIVVAGIICVKFLEQFK